MTLLGLTLRQHLGGRWAVSLLLFVVYVPIGIVGTIGNLSTAEPGTSLGLLLLASTASLVPVGLILWASDLTWLRHRRQRPVPAYTIVLLGAVIGMARSLSMYVISVRWGIQQPQPTIGWARTVTGGIQGAAVYPLAVLVFSLFATYRDQRSRLLSAQVAWESRQLMDARRWAELKASIIDPVAGELAILGDDLDRRAIDVDEAARSVRARAHDLWGDAQPQAVVPRIGIARAIAESLRVRPFATWLILAVWLPTALGTAIAVGTLPAALLGALLSGVLLVLVFEAANALTRRRPNAVWVILPGGLLVAIVLTSPALDLAGGMPQQGSVAYSLVNALWLTLLVLGSAVVVAAVRRSEEVLLRIHERVDAVEIETLAQEEERRRLVRDVATTLHGSLQGRLAALGSGEDAGAVVRETLALLRLAPTDTADVDLADKVRERTEPWRSLMEIDLSCAAMLVPHHTAALIVDAVDELFANAFRHGRAHRVTCTLSREGDAVAVLFCDDGEPGQGDPGLGSRVLDRAGTWSRTAEGDGSTVRLRAPLPSSG